MRPEVLTRIEGLVALEPQWRALWHASPGATPFSAPDWLLPWWQALGEGQLHCIALHRDGALAALLPCYRHADGRILPIGIGTTDYLDALALPGAVPHLPAMLAACDGPLEWPQLRNDCPLSRAAAPSGWHSRLEPAEPCPVLALPSPALSLGTVVSGKTLRDLRQHRRRAEEFGAAAWQEATAETWPVLLDALLALHAARWESQGEAGVLADPRVQRMHRLAIPRLLAAGLLRLVALRLGGRLVAVLYALQDVPQRPRRRLYLYLSGFDPALERCSPGLLLVGWAVETALAEGFACVDFLRGQERYKYFWGARDEPTWRRVLNPP